MKRKMKFFGSLLLAVFPATGFYLWGLNGGQSGAGIEIINQAQAAGDITDKDEEANLGDPDEKGNIDDLDQKANMGDPDEKSNIDDPDEKKNIGDPEEEKDFKHK